MPCPNCRCPSCLVLADSTVPSKELPLPPRELLTMDRAPTKSEVAYSEDVINFAEKTLLLIEATVVDLEKRKNELLGLINTHRAATSPLRFFPPELLAEIFGQFVAMVETRPYSKHSPLFTLMGICSRWRRIVMDTPRLWTKISTTHPEIDSWVTRSKQLPLHLDLDLYQAIPHPSLEALIPHSHRWEQVDFRLDPISPCILARVKTRLHSLKRLNLCFDYPIGTVDFCEVAPQLAEVKLTGIYNPVNIKLPWEQLRVCTLDSSESTLFVLQRAKNLWKLHLDMSILSEPPWLLMPRDAQSHHLGLNTLIIEWSFLDSETNLFFSLLTLPSLRTLEVLFDHLDSSETLSPTDAATDRAELTPILAAFLNDPVHTSAR